MLNKQLIEAMQDTDRWLVLFCRQIELTDSCWLWNGAAGHDSVPVYVYKYKTTNAYKVAYNLANDNEPDASVGEGNVIMHSCDNAMCVNPDHLSVGTHWDNTQDAIKKGRGPRYTPMKLSYELAEKIRTIYEAGGITQLELAKEYNVSLRNMQMLIAHDIWNKPRVRRITKHLF